MSNGPLRLPRPALSMRQRTTVREIVPAARDRGERRGSKVDLKKQVSVRDSLLEAFERVGGTEWLVLLAMRDPKTFAALLAKCLPTKVEADEKLAEAMVKVVTGINRNPGEVIDQPPQVTAEDANTEVVN